jgi:NAD+ diphosphatase
MSCPAPVKTALGVKTEQTERMKYCPECASTLELRRIDGVERKACVSPECSFVHWDNPVPVVAALIEHQGKIILARNSQWPEGMFSLVTGYLERNETPGKAVVREVKEELGLDSKAQEFIGCYSFIEKNQIILAHGVVATGELKTGNEITEVRLLSREELKRWQFGRLALTSAIVKQWLKKTTPNKALQPTSPLTRRRV